MYIKNQSGQHFCFQGVDSATGGIKSGVSWTTRRCIDGTFAAATGTATEDGTTGWYKFAMSQADTNGNNIGFNFTGTGAIPQTVNIVTTVLNPYDAVRFGMTALPNAAAEAAGGLYTRGSGAGQIAQSANGRIDTNVSYFGGVFVTGRDIGDGVNVADWKGATAPAMTGDAYARLGNPAGASVSADVAAIKSDSGAIKTKTDYLPSATAGAAGGVFIAGTNAATTITTALTTTFTGDVTGSVGSLATQAKADVSNEVDNVIKVSSITEPGQGVPAANASLATKVSYLYKAFRNKVTEDGSSLKIYSYDDATVDQKATTSDSGGTFTKGQIGTGP